MLPTAREELKKKLMYTFGIKSDGKTRKLATLDNLADFIESNYVKKECLVPIQELRLHYAGGPKAHTPIEFISAIQETLKLAKGE